MQILGLLDAGGKSQKRERLPDYLKECLDAAQAYAEAESEPTIDILTAYIDKDHGKEWPLELVKNADAVVLALPGHRLEFLHRFISNFGYSANPASLGLRGKWLGLIVCGAGVPYQARRYADMLLGECNRAGALLPPNAMADMNHPGVPAAHMRIGENIARALGSQENWKGFTAWSTAA